VDLVADRLLAHLPPGPALYPQDFLTDRPERFFVAELIREALLERVEQELPFSSAVVIRQFEEHEGDDRTLLRIFADILVERESQKGIVVGRGGRMIKDVGTAARKRIEKLLGAKVYLDLRVKARPGWREDPRVLKELEPIEAMLEPGEGE
jgi:GTP-binding protein Era